MTIKEFKMQYALGTLSTCLILEVADSPNTPIDVLRMLSTDEYWEIRKYATDNITSIRMRKIKAIAIIASIIGLIVANIWVTV